MAEFVNPIGKIRGKYGNVIGYVRADGKNCCKSASLNRKSGGEPQKRAVGGVRDDRGEKAVDDERDPVGFSRRERVWQGVQRV